MNILQYSEHFQLIFDNSNKTNQIFIKFFFLILLREATWKSKVAPTNLNSSAFLFSIFSQIFFGTNFRYQNKSNVIEIINGLFLPAAKKKYCVCYVSEHLKYCTQINEYWLNKNACLNIILLRIELWKVQWALLHILRSEHNRSNCVWPHLN